MTALHRDAMVARAPSHRASPWRVEPPARLSAGHAVGPFMRPAASVTASAAICTTRRTVALGARLRTDVAALSRIGPIVRRARRSRNALVAAVSGRRTKPLAR